MADTRAVSQVYIETTTQQTSPSRAVTATYVESLTQQSPPPRAVTQQYIEVITVIQRQFIGWGVPA